MKGEYEVFVHFGDTDAAQIVYYPNYYKWMDQATHHLFRTYDYSLRKLQENDKIIVPLLEANCKFYRVLRFEDEVTVYSSIDEIARKVFYVTHRFESKDGTVIAEGKETRGWVSIQDGNPKAIEIADHYMEKLKG